MPYIYICIYDACNMRLYFNFRCFGFECGGTFIHTHYIQVYTRLLMHVNACVCVYMQECACGYTHMY